MDRRAFFSFLLPAAAIAADEPKEKCVEPKNVNVTLGASYFCECGFAMLPSEKFGEPQTLTCVNGNCKHFGVVFDMPTIEATEHRTEAQLKACDEVREGEKQ